MEGIIQAAGFSIANAPADKFMAHSRSLADGFTVAAMARAVHTVHCYCRGHAMT